MSAKDMPVKQGITLTIGAMILMKSLAFHLSVPPVGHQ